MAPLMEYSNEDVDIYEKVNSQCEFIDLDNYICRFIEAGLRPGRYTDSLCPFCLSGLEELRVGVSKKI